MSGKLKRTRLSLFYLATYLYLTGVGLLAAPGVVMKMLFASGDYGDVMPRFAGVLMIGLAVIVTMLIRARAEALYPATLITRLVIWVCTLGIYLYSRDPFFLAVLGVVGLGILLTGSAYLAER